MTKLPMPEKLRISYFLTCSLAIDAKSVYSYAMRRCVMDRANLDGIIEGIVAAARSVHLDQGYVDSVSGSVKSILEDFKEMNEEYAEHRKAVLSKLRGGIRRTPHDPV